MIIFWVLVAVVMVVIEMLTVSFGALFLAIGAVVAAAVAVFAPESIPLQIGAAGASTVVGLVAVRPIISRALDRSHQGHRPRGVHGGIVGEQTITLDEVGEAPHVGHVTLAGERWLAVSAGGLTLPPGTRVVVTGVRGTTLQVWPIDEPELPAADDRTPPEMDSGSGADGESERGAT